jgi:hypothetical protein
MSDKEDIRRIRDERVDNVYTILSDLVMHEDERFTDTINISVLVQTILLAGLIQLNTLDQSPYLNNHVLLLLKNLLPLVGTLLCINALYLFHRRIEAMSFWKDQIYRIEADNGFIGEQYGGGLNIHTLRKAHREKKRSTYPRLINDTLKYQRYFMPILFLITWVLILGYQLYSYL